MLRSIGVRCVLAALFGLACAKSPPPEPAPAPDPSRFSGERAWEHLERLAAIGPRVAGTPGGEEAREYIRAQLTELGLEPIPRAFAIARELAGGEVEQVDCETLLAEIPGESDDIVVLAAPFDSRHFESFTHVAANNGASGAALLLEMARLLSADPIPYTVWLAFLDGEAALADGVGFAGSRALVSDIQEIGAFSRIRLLVYFNQVADRDLVIARDLYSDRVVRRAFQRAARELGHESAFPSDRPFSRPPGGHRAFQSAGFRRVMAVVDDRFGGDEAPGVYWQTEEDTLERCDPSSLAIVGAVTNAALRDMVALLRKVDRFSSRPAPLPPEETAEEVETPEAPGTSEAEEAPSP